MRKRDQILCTSLVDAAALGLDCPPRGRGLREIFHNIILVTDGHRRDRIGQPECRSSQMAAAVSQRRHLLTRRSLRSARARWPQDHRTDHQVAVSRSIHMRLSIQVVFFMLTTPAFSVELFRYCGAAENGRTMEYVFEAGEQNSP